MLETKLEKDTARTCATIRNCCFGTKAQSLLNDSCKKSVPQVPLPSPDLSYLLSKGNRTAIIENIAKRTEISYERASALVEELYQTKEELKKAPTENNRNTLIKLASTLPNLTHPSAKELKEPKVLKELKWEPKTPLNIIHPFEKLGSITGGLRTHDTAQVASERSYYLFGQFAELEQALIR
jgi:seryl-tRNA synthetase